MCSSSSSRVDGRFVCSDFSFEPLAPLWLQLRCKPKQQFQTYIYFTAIPTYSHRECCRVNIYGPFFSPPLVNVWQVHVTHISQMMVKSRWQCREQRDKRCVLLHQLIKLKADILETDNNPAKSSLAPVRFNVCAPPSNWTSGQDVVEAWTGWPLVPEVPTHWLRTKVTPSCLVADVGSLTPPHLVAPFPFRNALF